MGDGIEGFYQSARNAEFLHLLDRLHHFRDAIGLGTHSEAIGALSFVGDAIEPALQGFDATVLVFCLTLLRAVLLDRRQRLREICHPNDAISLILHRLVRTEA